MLSTNSKPYLLKKLRKFYTDKNFKTFWANNILVLYIASDIYCFHVDNSTPVSYINVDQKKHFGFSVTYNFPVNTIEKLIYKLETYNIPPYEKQRTPTHTETLHKATGIK